MNAGKLLRELSKLEIELQQPEVRSNADRLNALLHDSFVEIGRSGQSYTKAEIVNALLSEKTPGLIWSQDFIAEEISEGVALLIYKSALMYQGKLTQHTSRSSLWQLTARGWQIRFHQGTATQAFFPAAT